MAARDSTASAVSALEMSEDTDGEEQSTLTYVMFLVGGCVLVALIILIIVLCSCVGSDDDDDDGMETTCGTKGIFKVRFCQYVGKGSLLV